MELRVNSLSESRAVIFVSESLSSHISHAESLIFMDKYSRGVASGFLDPPWILHIPRYLYCNFIINREQFVPIDALTFV
jgi:hypothetical protein